MPRNIQLFIRRVSNCQLQVEVSGANYCQKISYAAYLLLMTQKNFLRYDNRGGINSVKVRRSSLNKNKIKIIFSITTDR